jgi:hypothetical protein
MKTMAKNKSKEEKLDATFEDYKGSKRFNVSHPNWERAARVAAPDQASAIVAASDFFGVKWTMYSFYAYCTVTQG